jgi:hypothetical protein
VGDDSKTLTDRTKPSVVSQAQVDFVYGGYEPTPSITAMANLLGTRLRMASSRPRGFELAVS